MIPFNDTRLASRLAEACQPKSTAYNAIVRDLSRQAAAMLSLLSGMVVSSEDRVRRGLAEILHPCGLTPIFASTVAESWTALAWHKCCIVLCDECLVDGDYRQVVEFVKYADTKPPVIVLSRNGDWPEYLAAISAGAYDYLAYPPAPTELRRVIRDALLDRDRQQHFGDF